MSPDVLQTIDPAVVEEILESQEDVDVPATTFRDTSLTEFGCLLYTSPSPRD